MAKESNNGLGVGQRYGALLDTSEVRSNKTEGFLNELVFSVTADLNDRELYYTLPIGAVVIGDVLIDNSLATPLVGANAPYSVFIGRSGKTVDTIALGTDANLATLINTLGSPTDQSVPDVLSLALVDQTVESGLTTVTIRYYNQRNK